MVTASVVNRENVVALIPARSGSKSVPRKNVFPLNGFPLIAYSIAAAKLSKQIERVVVTTDSEEIAALARTFGAEAPFIRPAELAGDLSPDRDFVIHALKWFSQNEGHIPELVVHLRPTSPLRDPALIDRAIDIMKQHSDAHSLRSAHEMAERPEKCFKRIGDFFEGMFPLDSRLEYHNLPRQSFTPSYKPDGYVDILRSSYILSQEGRLHGDKILAFITPDTGDIDSLKDIERLKAFLSSEHWSIVAYLQGRSQKG